MFIQFSQKLKIVGGSNNMGKEYSTPVVEFEAYNLTNQIAGACSDAGKTPVGNVGPINLAGTKVHCLDLNEKTDTTTIKNCSEGAHTWTVSLTGTIFADGNKEGGCTHDVYTQEQYVNLLITSLGSGSTISGNVCSDGKHFCFKGNSHEHTGSFEAADYRNYFQS